MLRKVITYTDFNDEVQEDVLYFNLSKAELGKLQMKMDGKFLDHIKALLEKKKIGSLYDFFYNLVLDAYGEKDASGKRFNKSPEIRASFENSIAFSEVLMDIISSSDNMAAFTKGILPPDMVSKMGEIEKEVMPPNAVNPQNKVGDINVKTIPARTGDVEPAN